MKVLISPLTKWAGRLAFALGAVTVVVAAALVLDVIYYEAVKHRSTGSFFGGLMVFMGLQSVALVIMSLIVRRAFYFLIKLPSIQQLDEMYERLTFRGDTLRAEAASAATPAEAQAKLTIAELIDRSAALVKDTRETWAGRKIESVNVGR